MQDQDRIARRAHELWDRQGRPEGRSVEHWTQACREIEAEDRAASADGAPDASPKPTVPDHGGTTPAEVAAAAMAVGPARKAAGRPKKR
jgi:hypothetical protein